MVVTFDWFFLHCQLYLNFDSVFLTGIMRLFVIKKLDILRLIRYLKSGGTLIYY